MDTDLLHLLVISAYATYDSCLVGNAPPATQYKLQKMRDYRPGHLIMEISTIWSRQNDQDRLGRLVHYAREPWPEWDEEEPAPMEQVWYIETLDGRLFRWHNASFIRVFTDLRQIHKPLPGSFTMSGYQDKPDEGDIAWAETAKQRYGITESSLDLSRKGINPFATEPTL